MVTAICQTDLYDPYLEAIGSPPEPASLNEAIEPSTCIRNVRGGDRDGEGEGDVSGSGNNDDDDENKSDIS
jgi:hypothetical protein